MNTFHPVTALVLAASLSFSGAGFGAEATMVVPEDLKWGPAASLGNAQMVVIDGDPSKAEPFVMRIKFPAGYRLEPHTHPADERVTVLSGTLHFAHGDTYDQSKVKALPEGSVAIMPAGEPMFGYTEEEVVVQLNGTGPWGIDYLDPQHDPRKR